MKDRKIELLELPATANNSHRILFENLERLMRDRIKIPAGCLDKQKPQSGHAMEMLLMNKGIK